METTKRFKKSSFGLDLLGSDISFQGWTDGSLWNGWSKPLFEFNEAQKLLDTLTRAYKQANEPLQAWYDSEEDSFYFILQEETEPEGYPAEVIEAEEGQKLKVYPIGAGAWVWEELPTT